MRKQQQFYELAERFRGATDPEEARRLGDELGRMVFGGLIPKIETWDKLPLAVRQHLIERMRDRSIGLEDLNRLRLWVESKPEVPEGDWYKDFGSFKICGQGPYELPNLIEVNASFRVEAIPVMDWAANRARMRSSRGRARRLHHQE